MSDIQNKYNIPDARQVELTAMIANYIRETKLPEIDAEVIIKRCNILLDNEKSMIREVIGEYLKSN